MSRSGYSDDCDGRALICWRGAVASAIKGKRGQAFLRELLEALDGMPVKELIPEDLERNGSYCALGVIGTRRGLDLKVIDAGNPKDVARHFKIAHALAAEVEFENDEGGWRDEPPEKRWTRMRRWTAENIK